jgi:hypothetical protein
MTLFWQFADFLLSGLGRLRRSAVGAWRFAWKGAVPPASSREAESRDLT